MKKLLLFLAVMFAIQLSYGQLTGTKTIPGDYATIEAAIVALNAQGVGSGGVTFNVAAGNTETFSVITAGKITTTTGSVSNTIIFQKSGGGANPLVTAALNGTGSTDYIFCIAGTDYITFNGIDVQENAGNVTTTTQAEWGYAILKASATDGSQNVTIKNCNISLNKANTATYAFYSNNVTPAAPTTQLTVTSLSGANANNKIFSNNITNTYNCLYLYGYADGTVPYQYYDQNNEFGKDGANTITGLGNTGGTSVSYGIYCYYQNGIKIANNTFTGTSANTTGSQYVMYLLTSNNANVDVYNNTISMTYNGTGSFYGIYASGFGSSGTTNTVNFYNNSIINNTIPNYTSGTIYFIYISTGGVTANFYGNNVSNNTAGSATATATGTIYYTYFASSPSSPGTTNMYNNTISDNARVQSVLGGGATYVFYNGGTGNVFDQYGNTINNITLASNGTAYVWYNLYSGATKNCYNNSITNILNANTTVYGLYNGNGTVAGYFYNNRIQNITMNSTAGTLYGIYQSSGVNQFYYNNFIGDLKAPVATGLPAIYGIYFSGATTLGAYDNTIYLNAASTGASFGVTALYASTTPNVELRNNIIVNNSTPGASGRVVAYQRSSTTLTTYTATSNNNNFYAGTPGALNLIYYDGTNSDQTLAAYKARVAPRDVLSVSENSPFVNVAATPYDLHLQTTVPTQCESGGATVSAPVNITTDYDGNARYPNAGYPNNASWSATAPDIGADEFGGLYLDLLPPSITVIPLSNTPSTSPRTLTVTIMDAGGVPTAGIGLPVLYWKINAGSWNSITAAWVSGSTYTFSNIGTGVVTGDVVSYYIVAQDLASTPNVIASPSAGASGYTVNPPACSTPPTSPYTYTITQAALSGNYTVGVAMFNSMTGKNISFERSVQRVMKEVYVEVPDDRAGMADATETACRPKSIKQLVEVEEVSWIPMENGRPYTGELFVSNSQMRSSGGREVTGVYATITAAITDLNLRGVSGPVTFLLTDATYPSETFPITVNVNNVNEPTSTNTVTIRPNTGVTAAVSGASASAQIFRILENYITIDGSNSGGTDRSLTIENTSATTPQVIVIGSTGTTPITNVTLKNCNIINGVNSSSAVIISDGTTSGTAGYFNNITLRNCTVQKAYIGVYCIAFVTPGNGSGLLLTENALTTSGTNSLRLVGLYVQGVDGATVSNNSIGNMANTADASNLTGIWFATGTVNSTISGNTISVISGTSTGPRGVAISSAVANANINITGNTISGLSTPSTLVTYGIYFFSTTSGCTIQKNKIFDIKNTSASGYSAIGIALASTLTAANTTVHNNLIYDVAGYGYGSMTTDNGYGMNIMSGGGYNLYFNSIRLSTNQTLATGNPACLIINSAVSTPNCLDIRNNIFYIDATAGTNRYAVLCNATNAVFSAIDYNDYFSTGPNLGYLGVDRLNLAAWKIATGKDVNSISADPLFTSTTDLRINLGSPVLAAGTPIAGVDFDYENNDRSNTNPSMGAYENGGDFGGPTITYTLLGNTTSTSNRSFSNVTITDYSGVNTTSGTRPRVYYKRSTDGNVWNNNTSGSDGWKWVEAAGTTSPFNFTIDYSLLNGGTGVSVGTIVQYFVVAQDLLAIPFVSINSGTFASTPASVALTSPAFPIGGSINSYQIAVAISGTITVGTGQTYTSLTADAATGLFKAVNNGVLTSNVIVNIVSDLTETGAIALNQMAEEPSGSNFTLTIQPNAATLRTISGSYTGGLIRLNGADRVTFDGRYGGSGNYLTFTNTVTTGTVAVFQFISLGANAGATNNTIRNCNINVGFNTSGSYGIVSGGSTVATTGADNDNNTIQNNTISKAYVGIWAQGSAITNPGVMDNLQILVNSVGATAASDYIGHDGIIVGNGTGCNISQNTIYNIITTTSTPVGLTLSTGFVSSTVSRNKINNITYSSTAGYGGRGMYISTGSAVSNLTIDNNLIYVIGGDGWSTFAGSSMVGMYFDGTMAGLNIYFNSVYMSGNYSRSSVTLTTAILFNTATITGINLRNNVFQNSMDNTANTTDFNYAIYSTAPASSFTDINYNDYYANGPQGVLGFLGANQLTLAAWQAATGKDVNSKNLDPLFASTTDLHPSATGIDNQGIYLPSLPTDFDGVVRTNPPDLGAYEFGTNPVVVSTAASGINCSGATLNGTINANTLTVNSYFDYGSTTAYGNSVAGVPPTVTGTSPVAISATISGLTPASLYHYRARGVTSGGVTTYGNDLTFTTVAAAAPTATTNAATNIGNNTATLNGTVNANCNSTTVTFEYGLTAGYGLTVTAIQSPVSGGNPVAVSADIAGLTINTTYHYRVVANSSAGTAYGSDMIFTSGAAPPTVVTNPATGISYFTAQLNGTVTANNQNTTVTFQWGLTASYGNTINGVPLTVTGMTATPVLANLSGLTHNTTYHFRCVGQNATGTTYGGDMMFTTLCRIPDPAGTITGPDSLCQATSGHVYSVPAVPYATGYTWSLPPGGTITAGANTNTITVSYNSTAVSGNVTVFGFNVCGNGTSSSLPVTVHPLPVPTISGADPACVGTDYPYWTESNGTGYTWAVSSGGQITAGTGTNVITVHWNNTGAQWVSVTYTSLFGCPAAAPVMKNVTVSSLPVPTIVGSASMCIGSGYHVYTTEQGFSNYQWTVTAGGTIVSGQGTYQVEVNWTVAGAQSVSVNYTNASGCFASTPTTFNVTVLTVPGAAGPITGTAELCAGTANVSYSVASIPGAIDYIWSVPAGAYISAGAGTNSIIVDFALNAVSGTITVYGANTCGNGAVSPAYSVTVNPIPEKPVVTLDNFTLHSSAPDGNQWYFEGSLIDGATGQEYEATEDGWYWTIVTLYGCVSDSSNHVYVFVTVGLDESQGAKLSIYPVPNNGQFTLSIVNSVEETYALSIINNLGVKVYGQTEIRINGIFKKTIDLGSGAEGIYTILLQSRDNRLIRKILITE